MTKRQPQGPSANLRFRLRLTGGLLLALLLAVALRAIQLQAFDGARLARLGERQHLQEQIFVPKRGTILTRNGDALAISVESKSVYVRPRRVKSPRRLVPAVARALKLKPSDVRRKVTSDKPFVWLKRQVTPREAQRIRALKLEGIGLYHEPKRYYPQGHLAGQALGLVGRDAQGLEGVERSYDRHIRGKTRSSLVERDALGRRVLVTGLDDLKIRPGADVRLTLDTTLQHLAEKHLEATVKRYRAKGGTVVCASIHMSDIPQFPYSILWEERVVRSVANLTRRDGRAFLDVAAKAPIETEIHRYPLPEANRALADLRSGAITGAAVLLP